MDRWSGKVAIVTGASVGIGAQIVEELLRHGLKVVGLARRIEKMQELAKGFKGLPGKFYPIQCDVRKEEDILKAFQWTEKELGGVDVLVNNAGVAVAEPIIDGKTEDYRKIMEVNVIAPAICAREAIRSMKKRNVEGHVIIVNSMAGHYANIIKVPVSLYAASKFAVTGMCHSLRNEVMAAKLPIKITSISPGAVDTDMLAGVVPSKDMLKNLTVLTSKDVSNSVLHILMTPPHVEICELIVAPTPSYF